MDCAIASFTFLKLVLTCERQSSLIIMMPNLGYWTPIRGLSARLQLPLVVIVLSHSKERKTGYGEYMKKIVSKFLLA